MNPLDRRSFLLFTAAAGASMLLMPLGALAQATTPDSADHRLTTLMDDFLRQILRESPELATELGMDTGSERRLRTRLDERSAQAVARDNARCRERLQRMDAIDTNQLSEPALITCQATRYLHQLAVDGAQFGFGAHALRDIVSQWNVPYLVSQMTGAFYTVPQLLKDAHPLANAADADAYLSRLDGYARALDEETARILADRAVGVTPPAFVLDTVLAQMDAALSEAPADSSLVRTLAERTRARSLRGAWAERAAELMQRRVRPALQRQVAQLRIARERARMDAGVGVLPQGEAYYAWQLRVATTCDMSADEIHRIGKERSAEIEGEMDALLRKFGHGSGIVGERMAALGREPRFLFADNEAGRGDALAYARELAEGIRGRLPQLFDVHLRAPLRIERVPIEIEAGAAGAYVIPGSADGSRLSTFYLNLRTTSAWPKWTLPTLVYHEALPGHIWQEARVSERRPWHPIRSLVRFNAYSEGWGLYAERIADEIGVHGDDLAARLGYLQAQQLRASRLVVDTGLHAQRWTRERAIEWMVRTTGRPREVMTGEVDRYCVKPGQACGYMMGQIAILRMRERMRANVGANFDIRTFNDAVLAAGNVPMTTLAAVIERSLAGNAVASP